MTSYFFPCLALMPSFHGNSLEFGNISVHKRLWDTSIFDLATLETKHTLHLPYQLMDIYLKSCNIEIELKSDLDIAGAIDELQMLRALLYLDGSVPFMVPFCTTYSINEYSGINSRDSESLRETMNEGLKNGLTSDRGRFEAWYCDRTWTLIRDAGTRDVTSATFADISADLEKWKCIENDYPIVNIVRRLFNSAPMIPDSAASVLQIWQGIESLFPTIHTEVTFRIALLIAQLCSPLEKRVPYTRKRSRFTGLDQRSRAAHLRNFVRAIGPMHGDSCVRVSARCWRAVDIPLRKS